MSRRRNDSVGFGAASRPNDQSCVLIAALLKLTEHEENLTVDEDDPLFEYLEAVAESDGRAEDDGDELDEQRGAAT